MCERLSDIENYLNLPLDERMPTRYKQELLLTNDFFNEEEVLRLSQLSELSEPINNHQLHNFLINLTWNSSQLEGNTYSQLDTQALIDYGQINKSKSIDEAIMIINHQNAINYLLETKILDLDVILKIHDLLMDDTNAENSRHFLSKNNRGILRSYTPNGLHIFSTTYLPPQVESRGFNFIKNEFETLLKQINTFKDPFNQAYYIFTRLPYLQPFYDGNKRMSRLLCNIPLLYNNKLPLTFIGFDKKQYLKSLISFYELNTDFLAKQEFLKAYVISIFMNLNLSESDRIEFHKNKNKYIEEVIQYIKNGYIPNNAIWIKPQSLSFDL